jgi:hypothetical protein
MRRFIAFVTLVTLSVSGTPLIAAQAQVAAGASSAVTTGHIEGIAATPAGQTLGNVAVRARSLQTGLVVADSTTDAAGAFAFVGLNPATYVVEAISQAGVIVGSSAATSVVAGATATVAVTTTAAAATAAAAGAAAAGTAAAGTAAAGTAAAAAAGTTAAATAAGVGLGGAALGGLSTALVVTSVAATAGIAGAVVVARDASPTR